MCLPIVSAENWKPATKTDQVNQMVLEFTQLKVLIMMIVYHSLYSRWSRLWWPLLTALSLSILWGRTWQVRLANCSLGSTWMVPVILFFSSFDYSGQASNYLFSFSPLMPRSCWLLYCVQSKGMILNPQQKSTPKTRRSFSRMRRSSPRRTLRRGQVIRKVKFSKI